MGNALPYPEINHSLAPMMTPRNAIQGTQLRARGASCFGRNVRTRRRLSIGRGGQQAKSLEAAAHRHGFAPLAFGRLRYCRMLTYFRIRTFERELQRLGTAI